MSDLRTRQRAATQDMILEAVQELVVEHHGWTVSMEEVAERAGVSRRTLYRHFPTKDGLLEAASHAWADPELDSDDSGLPGLGQLRNYLTTQWNELSANLPAVLAKSQSPFGREMRARWVPRARNAARKELTRLLDRDAEGIEGLDDLSDLVIVLASLSMFLELVDRLDRTPDDAARIVAWAVEAIVERAERDGGLHE